MKIFLKLRNETKGAVRYEEVRTDGKVFTVAEGAALGSMYIRKTMYPNGKYPEYLTLEINEGLA